MSNFFNLPAAVLIKWLQKLRKLEIVDFHPSIACHCASSWSFNVVLKRPSHKKSVTTTSATGKIFLTDNFQRNNIFDKLWQSVRNSQVGALGSPLIGQGATINIDTPLFSSIFHYRPMGSIFHTGEKFGVSLKKSAHLSISSL